MTVLAIRETDRLGFYAVGLLFVLAGVITLSAMFDRARVPIGSPVLRAAASELL